MYRKQWSKHLWSKHLWSKHLWSTNRVQYLYLLVILMLAVAIRLVGLSSKGLGYDELQSVTHSSLSITELIKSVKTFDPHPPLYYLQLHFWMLLSKSDWWIQLNSVIWSVFTIILIFMLSKDLFNSHLALIAALIFAVSPFAVYYAQVARMYSWLMFLGIGSFVLVQRFVNEQKWGYLVGAGLLTDFFLYSHGASFLLLVSLVSYMSWHLLESRLRQWKIILQVGFGLLIVTILYLPWLRAAATISVKHTFVPDWDEVIHTLFILGYGVMNGLNTHPSWVEWIAVIITIGVMLVVLLFSSKGRALVLAFIIAPIVFCLVVSYWYRPIWLYRTLAYTAPFASIATAVFAFQIGSSWVKGTISRSRISFSLTLITVIVLLFCTGRQKTNLTSDWWHIRDIAQFLRSVTKPGDTVYVASERVFWGMGWYFVGPGSVNPLTTNYINVSPSDVALISRRALSHRFGRSGWWLVYSPIDDITPFVVTPSDSVWDFGSMKVVQLKHSPVLTFAYAPVVQSRPSPSHPPATPWPHR